MPGEATVPVLKLPVGLLSNLHAKKLSKLFFLQNSYIYIVDITHIYNQKYARQ